MASVTVQRLITQALLEINVLGGGDVLSAEDGTYCLERLNQLFDLWNAQREAVYAEKTLSFTFVASQQDYTIGPAGADFTSPTTRPVSIEAANVILNNVSPAVRNPLNLRDYQWWANLPVVAIETSFPTDLYYAPDWPLGVLHFWPKPTTTYGVELITRVTLADLTMADSYNLPPGYQVAGMLTLAEDVASAYGRQPTPLTMTKAREARAKIFANNGFTPTLQTQDAGMPSGGRNRCAWNFRTGLPMVNR